MATISDIKTPEITTLSVEVKALRIGEKQCTLTIFDQIPILDFSHFGLSDLEKINYWGKVKRKTTKGKSHKGFIWYIVFEHNGQLCKSEKMIWYKVVPMEWFSNEEILPKELAATFKSYTDKPVSKMNSWHTLDFFDAKNNRIYKEKTKESLRYIHEFSEWKWSSELKKKLWSKWEKTSPLYDRYNKLELKIENLEQLFIGV